MKKLKDTQGSFENYDGKFTNNVVYTEIFQFFIKSWIIKKEIVNVAISSIKEFTEMGH